MTDLDDDTLTPEREAQMRHWSKIAGGDWPGDLRVLLAEVDRLRARVRELEATALRLERALSPVSIEAGVYAENGSGPESKPLVDEVYAALSAARVARGEAA